MSLFRKPRFKRSTRSWTSLILTIFLVLGIGIFLEIIAFNQNARIDLTPGQIYSLSDQSIKILKALKKDIQFTVFYQQGDRKKHDDFFRLVSFHTDHFKYKLIDLDRNPGVAQLNGIAAYGQTIVDYEGKKVLLDFPTEEKIMNTILKVTGEPQRKIYFIGGHEEKTPKDEFLNLSNALGVEAWEVGIVNLAGVNDIPPRASVLVLGGPKHDLLEEELEKISQFIQSGGKVIFMVEPFVNLPRLERFLRRYQVILGDGVIVDKEHRLYEGDYLTALVPFFARSPITSSLKSPALFPTARPIELKDDAGRVSFISYLAKTSSRSWIKKGKREVKEGKVDFQRGVDQEGPVYVAAVVILGVRSDKPGDAGAIVCFGDSDFVANEFLDVGANKDLFLNTVDWLVQKENLLSIRPKKYEYPFHHMTVKQTRWVFWRSVVVTPGIFLLIGIVVLTYRKYHS